MDTVKEQICYQSFVKKSLDIEDFNRLFSCKEQPQQVFRIRTRVCTVIYHKATWARDLEIEFGAQSRATAALSCFQIVTWARRFPSNIAAASTETFDFLKSTTTSSDPDRPNTETRLTMPAHTLVCFLHSKPENVEKVAEKLREASQIYSKENDTLAC